ncbi:MAG: PTS system mannose/fructose/N-acetylgalactosamine-transporter subunit IIB [Gemmatimonadales bacterium]
MPVLLYRVDDRLIHGQVVLGWGQAMGVEFIVLVDDQVRASAWEQDLYRMGVPGEVELIFADVAEAVRRLPEWEGGPRRGLVLTGDLDTMSSLRAGSRLVGRINLGGIHHKPGRTERLPYLYLTDEELRSALALAESGAEVTAQDLPGSPPVPVRTLA